MRARAPISIVAVLLASMAGGTAHAQGLTGQASTYVRGFVEPADNDAATYLPFFELVDLHVRRLGVDGLSLHAGLWGMVDALDEQERHIVTGDVTTLFVDYVVPEGGALGFLRGMRVTAGRQFVSLGPSILEQVDGAKLHYIHSSGLELGMFGGLNTGIRMAFQPWPVDDDDYGYGSSWLVGGRLGYVSLGWLSGGASYVHRRYDGGIAANDLGADLRISAHRMLDLAGSATFAIEATRVKEGRAAAIITPLRGLILQPGYRFSSPDLWIPRTSIFAVFSEESFQEAQLDAKWRISRRVTVGGGYGRRFYTTSTEDGPGDVDEIRGANRASAEATYRLGDFYAGRVLGRIERIESPDNAVNRVRVATSLPFRLFNRTFEAIGDINLFVLDEEIRDTHFGVVATGFVEAPIIDQLTLMAGGGGGRSPYLVREGHFMVRLTWAFGGQGNGDVLVTRGRVMR